MRIASASCSYPHTWYRSVLLSLTVPMDILSLMASLGHSLTETPTQLEHQLKPPLLFCFFWDRVLRCIPGSPWTFRDPRCLCLLCAGITGGGHGAQPKPILYILCKGKLFCRLSFIWGCPVCLPHESQVMHIWQEWHITGLLMLTSIPCLKFCFLDQKKQSLFQNLDLVFTHLGSKPERSSKPISTLLRLGLIGICRMPSLVCGCWTLSSGPHDYTQVLLVAGITLYSLFLLFSIKFESREGNGRHPCLSFLHAWRR